MQDNKEKFEVLINNLVREKRVKRDTEGIFVEKLNRYLTKEEQRLFFDEDWDWVDLVYKDSIVCARTFDDFVGSWKSYDECMKETQKKHKKNKKNKKNKKTMAPKNSTRKEDEYKQKKLPIKKEDKHEQSTSPTTHVSSTTKKLPSRLIDNELKEYFGHDFDFGAHPEIISTTMLIKSQFTEVNKKFDEVNKKFDEVNKKFDEVNKKFDDLNEKMELRFNSVERKVTSMYELIIEPKLRRTIDDRSQKSLMNLEPRKFVKNYQNINKNHNILLGFKCVESLAETDYLKIILETNKPDKLDPYTPSIQINFWGEYVDGKFCIVEGTMSDLMGNNMVLLTKLLQLERQIMFAQGFKGFPESVGFVSPSLDGSVDFIKQFLDKNPRYQKALLNVNRYLESNQFFAINIGALPDIE